MVRSNRFVKRLAGAALSGFVVIFLVIVTPLAQGPQKIKIDSLDQLPRHNYELSCSPEELLKSSALFKEFASNVRADIEADLAAYEITDNTTLERWRATLVTLDMMDGRYDAALSGLLIMKELQDKPARKHTSGLMDRPLVAALKAAGGDTGSPVFKQVFRREFAAQVKRLPRDIVQNEVEQMKGVLEMFSESMLLGLVSAQFAPAVEKSGSISRDLALQLINVQNFLTFTLPVKKDVIIILGAWIEAGRAGADPLAAADSSAAEAGRTATADIWPGRAVSLTQADLGQPVVVAIWDTGVEVDLFEDVLFTNLGERVDGRDTDGNGYVDDIHGIAYDLNWEKTGGLMYPLGESKSRTRELIGLVKGYFDLQSAVDSPEAADVKGALSSLASEDVGSYLEDLMRCAIYVHGTHVAGLAAEGNPFVRILITRLEPDYRNVPALPSVRTARRAAAAFDDIIAYYKDSNVRIVNMSWGIVLKEIERQLEKNGYGSNAGQRAAEARKIFDIMSGGLRAAIESAPGILFVAAAGNSDADVAFEEFCPSSFDLPNLLAAGAVDRAGRETSFTCFGERIRIYSNGFEVEGIVPGGRQLAFSGTSMAAPQVVNLAAKLLALKTSLTPTEIIELIEAGATKSKGAKQFLLIHPSKTVELLRNRMAGD